MTKKSVFITGATGFVGSHLLSHIDKTTWWIKAVSRSLAAVSDNETDIKWFNANFSDSDTDYSQFLSGCHSVVHLAGQAHDPSTDYASYELLNHTITRRLAQAAAANGVRHFIFVSTIKVNGGDYVFADRAYREGDRVFPQGHYGESKWRGEQALREICETNGMRCTILRPPLIYGPGVKANFLSLMQLVRRGLPLPLAAVENRRSLLYVDNLCDVICRLLEHGPRENSTYVIGDETLSTPQLIRSMAESLGVKPRLFSMPVPLLMLAGMMTGKRSMVNRLTNSLVVDDSALRRDLNWQPSVTLERGMKETGEWFLSRLK